ncbi:Protein CMSS1, partial [Nibea albiflora]
KDPSEAEEETHEKQPTETPNTKTKPAKRKKDTEKAVKAKKKKKSEQTECVTQKKEAEDEKSAKPKKKRKKKKTITDVLSSSEPKPGCPADLQNLVTQYFSDKRSVIEQEELRLPESCFLSSNDLTHTLSSYLKQGECRPELKSTPPLTSEQTLTSSSSSVAPSLSKVGQDPEAAHGEEFCGSAHRLQLGSADHRAHQIDEQVKQLEKGVTHIGVGTPGRISALIEKEGLNLGGLRYLVLDWNWRDQKLRRMVDVPEVKLDFMKLLESGVLTGCKQDKVKVGLF